MIRAVKAPNLQCLLTHVRHGHAYPTRNAAKLLTYITNGFHDKTPSNAAMQIITEK